jgi:hypothetical protein
VGRALDLGAGWGGEADLAQGRGGARLSCGLTVLKVEGMD